MLPRAALVLSGYFYFICPEIRKQEDTMPGEGNLADYVPRDFGMGTYNISGLRVFVRPWKMKKQRASRSLDGIFVFLHPHRKYWVPFRTCSPFCTQWGDSFSIPALQQNVPGLSLRNSSLCILLGDSYFILFKNF